MTRDTDALISDTQSIIDHEQARIRMAILHKLKAAPGESNRDVVRHFLKVKGWIKDGQEPEDWPIRFIPHDHVGLMRDVDEFSQRQARL